MSLSVVLGAWVAVGLTIAIYSFLYKDNPIFKLAEHLYIGVSVGYSIVQIIYQSAIPKWFQPLSEGKLVLIVPTIIGFMLLLRFFPKVAWLSRWSLAFIVGYGAGRAIPRTVSSYIVAQVQGTVVPLVKRTEAGMIDTSAGGLFADFTSLIILVGVLSVLFYFFFSVEHKGALEQVSKLGIYFLMVSFGASFGYTVLARVSLLFGRFYDLVQFSSRDYYYATPLMILLAVSVLGAWSTRQKRRT